MFVGFAPENFTNNLFKFDTIFLINQHGNIIFITKHQIHYSLLRVERHKTLHLNKFSALQLNQKLQKSVPHATNFVQ